MKILLRKLGARIREERKVRNLTQEQLAEKIDITPRYLSRLEGGQQSPSLETLTKLAGIFEIELQELFNFHHIATPKELRARLNKFMNELDDQKLSLTVRLLKAVVQ